MHNSSLDLKPPHFAAIFVAMKILIQKTLTISMALLILISSTGFGFVEHQCLVRGKSVQLFSSSDADGCRACRKIEVRKPEAPAKAYFKKAACCKDSTRLEKMNAEWAGSHLLVKLLKALASDVVFESAQFTFSAVEWLLEAAHPGDFISFSSLHSGRCLLAFVQSFLI